MTKMRPLTHFNVGQLAAKDAPSHDEQGVLLLRHVEVHCLVVQAVYLRGDAIRESAGVV